jgi:uroporphyrinogen-III synthase
MTSGDSSKSRTGGTPGDTYDDVPMPETLPPARQPAGLPLPPVWVVVVVVIVLVVGFVASPVGQRLAGFDLAALLAQAEEAADEAGPSIQALERRLSGIEAALAMAEAAISEAAADSERFARQADVGDNRDQIARIAQSVMAFKESAASAAGVDARVTVLENALSITAQLGDRVGFLETAAESDQATRDIGSLRDRVSVLEQTPAPTQTTDAEERLVKLQRRVEAIERTRGGLAETNAQLVLARRRIDGLEAAAAAGTNEQVAALDQRLRAVEVAVDQTAVNALELRVGALEAGLIDAAPADELRALGAKLGALERVAADAGRSAALAVAVARLREAARLSEPYVAALDEARALAGALRDADLDAALTTIGGRAAAGVPNLEALRQQFADLAVPILRAAGLDGDAGWFAKTVNRLSSVVSVRRIGEVTGPTVEAHIARAEARLDGGDLAAAIGELAALDAPPGGALAGWLDDARARIALDRALDDVSARALTLLGAS